VSTKSCYVSHDFKAAQFFPKYALFWTSDYQASSRNLHGFNSTFPLAAKEGADFNFKESDAAAGYLMPSKATQV
jgi:hypothetical protein